MASTRPHNRRRPRCRTQVVLVAAVLTLSTGCSGGPAQEQRDGAVDNADGAPDRDGGELPPCSAGGRACSDTEHERVCEESEGVGSWIERACDPYHYCLVDRCEAACLDECALGESRSEGGTQQVCRLYSTAEQDFVATGNGMHDRSRLHDAWIRAHHLANGYVAEALHADTTYAEVTAYWGTVDSAEWTGTYLAAEALRLMATGAPDAERIVEAEAEKIHELFDVTGDPGYMARIWAPRGTSPVLDALYDSGDWSHHLTSYQGGDAFWHGWTSRDMYSGALFGLGLAYDALTSESHREMIRADVVALAMELIKTRSQVPVTVRFNFAGDWQEQELLYDMQHTVLVPSEMVDGRVFIQVGSDESPSDYAASELVGAREFLPDFTSVLGQTPLIGAFLPPVPRPGSAMMLAYFLRLALHVTDGVPSWATQHAAIDAHYQANKGDWLAVMEQYAYHNEEECWQQYFGMTIAFHSLYALLRLETDASLKAAIRANVLAANMWPHVVGHKNPYFDYITAAHGPAELVTAGELAATASQLGEFVAPPKARVAVDNSGAYPGDPDCPGLASEPIDVGDRVASDFLWQHHPFALAIPNPEPRLVYAGADYLVAYWLGRYHGYLADDAANTCLRWATSP